jgi:hypothetical protein
LLIRSCLPQKWMRRPRRTRRWCPCTCDRSSSERSAHATARFWSGASRTPWLRLMPCKLAWAPALVFGIAGVSHGGFRVEYGLLAASVVILLVVVVWGFSSVFCLAPDFGIAVAWRPLWGRLGVCGRVRSWAAC